MYTIGGYIYHHGILGQKWGDRNGPPYPLDSSDHSASEKKAGYKKSIGGGRNEELYDRNEKTENKKVRKNRYDRMASRYEKRADKLEKQGQNSKANNARKYAEKLKQTADKERVTYKDKLIKRYKEYGLTEKQAQEAADRKIAIEKGIVVGAVTVAALAGAYYVNREIGRNITGKIIKKGTVLQTLSRDSDRIQQMVDSGEHFYTTFTKKDKLTYMADFGGLTKYINKAKATGDIAVASRNQGIDVLKKTLSTSTKDQRSEIYKALTDGYGFRRVRAKGDERVNIMIALQRNDFSTLTKKELGVLYDGINYKLGDQEGSLQTFRPKLYSEFVNNGYGGLIDTNDTRYSALVGDFPTIIIDKTKFDVLPSTKATTAQKTGVTGFTLLRVFAGTPVAFGETAFVTGMAANNAYEKKQQRNGYLNLTEQEVKKKAREYAKDKYITETNRNRYKKLVDKYVEKELEWYNKHKTNT